MCAGTARSPCAPASCKPTRAPPAGQERMSEFELKLMDINSENLGIPETDYTATVSFGVGGCALRRRGVRSVL